MSTYVIGDLQGCLDSLRELMPRLLEADRLIFVGDLVNRGPQSLEALRFVRDRALQGNAAAVLGNHDLHLLAADAGIRPMHRSDTLQPILDAPDRRVLVDWMRTLPLALFEKETLIVHAGVPPPWTCDDTLARSAEVQRRLCRDDYRGFLEHMYGNRPDLWSDTLTGNDRLRFIVNALTRLRIVDADGRMQLKFKDEAAAAPAGSFAWFEHPARATRNRRIVCGHWSTEGLVQRCNVVGIDTGCVWGGKLTAVRLEDGELFQVDCPQSQAPGRD